MLRLFPLIAFCIALSCAVEEKKKPAPVMPVLAREQLRQKLAELQAVATAIPEDLALYNLWENMQMNIRRTQFLLDNCEDSEIVRKLASEEIWRAESVDRAISMGGQVEIITGQKEEGYYSDNDRSFQPFMSYVPEAAGTDSKKLPLIIFLHGYSPFLNIINWAYLPSELVEFAEEEGFYVASPFGRSNTDFQSIGEQDVLTVIRKMKERYHIDEDRVILAGHSMGGMGAWTIGVHHPDMFAGLLVISGRGDYYYWQGIDAEDSPAYKRRLIDAEFAHALLRNLKNIPIFCAHGALDELVPVLEGRHMMRAVSEVNADAIYIELEDGGHIIGDDTFARSDVQKWLLSCRRTVPLEFDYVTWHSQYNRCHWLALGDMVPAEFPAKLSVKVVDDRIVIDVSGARSVYLLKSKLPPVLDGLPVTIKGDARLVKIEDEHNPLLIPVRRGPVKEAFLAPFVFISCAHPADAQGMAKFRSVVRDWHCYAKAYPRVAHVSGVQPEEFSRYNVFLFGEPESSAAIREVLAITPIKITEEEFIIGTKKFPRAGNGLWFVYRSPWNQGRLASVQCGELWGSGLPENHKYDFLPDYIVYSTDRDDDGSNRALCAGFFDEKGQIVPALMSISSNQP